MLLIDRFPTLSSGAGDRRLPVAMLIGLDGLPLAARVGAFVLEHLEPAVAFAVIPLAVVLGGLAIALALASIDAKAATLEGLGIGGGDERRPGNDQRGGGHGHFSTGFLGELQSSSPLA